MSARAIGVLRDPKWELFAQGIISGLSKPEAYQKAGYTGNPLHGGSRMARIPLIMDRVKELLDAAARRSELSRKEILDRIYQDWELARKLGQMASALKAGEMMGKELHRMFVERREVGGPGDFDNKSEEELREIIKKELGDLGWEGEEIPPSTSMN